MDGGIGDIHLFEGFGKVVRVADGDLFLVDRLDDVVFIHLLDIPAICLFLVKIDKVEMFSDKVVLIV